ncbi:protein TolQ [Acanthopleuribacter pedis]|uniref:Protein TolQ n=1 Tax=Acanthopleuribacter pedis TaxID=442870 RepID=A0A8J7U4S7_9BACT|nr:protein TolQ [Acanthopleuribacter pedis]MBO1319768.1 protein TolQ [Acanthopleuribacter pedis]
MNYFELLLEASLVAKLVLLMLIFFSVACWVLIVQKQALFRKTRNDTDGFLQLFRGSSRFSEVKTACKKFDFSPQVGLFLAGFSELQFQLKHQPAHEKGEQPRVRSLESINRVLQRASFVELSKLEKNLNHLATIAAVAPFVGLLGTVWGIIEAFADIGEQKSASLAVVAPGIAEALIATAVGLFAAIPAVMAYNYFINKVQTLSAEMEDFCLEFVGIVEKNFT